MPFIKPIVDAVEIRLRDTETISSKNNRRKRVVEATCMIVTCKVKKAQVKQSVNHNPEPIAKVVHHNRFYLLY